MSDNQTKHKRQDQEVLHLLRVSIEEKLGWGQGVKWNGADFERLSDLVFEETGKRLSVSTLKRLWGRTSANVQASRTTLDILSNFVGENSWRAISMKSLSDADKEMPTTPGRRNHKLFLGSTLIAALLFTLALVGFLNTGARLEPNLTIDLDRVFFSVEKVTTGIPNTVIFRYDLDGQQVDSLELQQSWDDRRRDKLDSDQHLVTSTYHSPGYYLAKLIADGVVLDSQHVYLPSNGVEVVEIRQEVEELQYRPQVAWTWQREMLSYTPEVMESDLAANLLGYQLSNLLPEPTISQDTFSLHMELRLTQGVSDNHCNPVSIFLTGAEDIYYFGLGHPGCSGNFQCFFGGKSISGKHHDLSSLGFLPGEWVTIEIAKSGNDLSLKVNGNTLIISKEAPNVGRVGGVSLQSEDLIELRRLSLMDPSKHINLIGEEFR